MELTEIVKFDVTEAACAHLANLYLDLRITSIDDLSGFRAVHEARMVVKGKRVEVEKRRKELKEEAVAYGRMVDGEAKRIVGLLEPIEKHLEEEEKGYIQKKEREKLKVLEAENRQLQEKFDALAGHGVILPWAEIRAMTPKVFAERMTLAIAAFEVERERQETERRNEEELRIKLEKEKAELKEIARQHARKDVELKAEEARIRANEQQVLEEIARLEAEKLRINLEADRLKLKEAEHLAYLKEKEFCDKILGPLAEELQRSDTIRIFNASGHPITQDNVEVVGEVGVPNVDLSDPAAVFSLALDIAKVCRSACENGIPIALPGMTTLSAHVLSMLQGLTGQLPIIAWASRVDGKFVWSSKLMIDLHAMRVLMREGRFEGI